MKWLEIKLNATKLRRMKEKKKHFFSSFSLYKIIERHNFHNQSSLVHFIITRIKKKNVVTNKYFHKFIKLKLFLYTKYTFGCGTEKNYTKKTEVKVIMLIFIMLTEQKIYTWPLSFSVCFNFFFFSFIKQCSVFISGSIEEDKEETKFVCMWYNYVYLVLGFVGMVRKKLLFPCFVCAIRIRNRWRGWICFVNVRFQSISKSEPL